MMTGHLMRLAMQSSKTLSQEWGRMGNADVTGRLSWLDCQRVAAETLARDGEVFIKKIVNRQYRDNFTLQFIESDLIDDQKVVATKRTATKSEWVLNSTTFTGLLRIMF